MSAMVHAPLLFPVASLERPEDVLTPCVGNSVARRNQPDSLRVVTALPFFSFSSIISLFYPIMPQCLMLANGDQERVP
jgi:hypothetical protein